jgi:hypothetical protein
LLAALSIIANQTDSEVTEDKGLIEGLDFAVSEQNIRIDLTAAMCRKIFTFVTNTSYLIEDYDKKLHSILSLLRNRKVVCSIIEDLLDTLVIEHDDLCSQLKCFVHDGTTNGGKELQLLASNVVKGIIKLSEYYDDSTFTENTLSVLNYGNKYNLPSTSRQGATEQHFRQEISYRCADYRRIFHLQTVYSIFLTRKEIGSPIACSQYIRNMVNSHVESVLNASSLVGQDYRQYDDASVKSSDGLVIAEFANNIVQQKIGKVAYLLGIGLSTVVLLVTRRMIDKGKKVNQSIASFAFKPN